MLVAHRTQVFEKDFEIGVTPIIIDVMRIMTGFEFG